MIESGRDNQYTILTSNPFNDGYVALLLKFQDSREQVYTDSSSASDQPHFIPLAYTIQSVNAFFTRTIASGKQGTGFRQ